MERLPAGSIIWTTGTNTHPLIKTLPIPPDKREKQGRPFVTPTLQLLDFPEVFAGGDCAAIQDQSLPSTAQVAYDVVVGAIVAKKLLNSLTKNDKH